MKTVLALICFLCLQAHAFAATGSEFESLLPPELKPWSSYLQKRLPDLPFELAWEKINKPYSRCPQNEGNSAVCVWPGSLSFEIQPEQGGRFEQRVHLDIPSYVEIPSATEISPRELSVVEFKAGSNGITQPEYQIHQISGKPLIRLPAGDFMLKGELPWSAMPEKLNLDPGSGLIQLKFDGNIKSLKPRAELGTIDLREHWLKLKEPNTDELPTLKVFRKIEGSIPLKITTVLIIQVPTNMHELIVPESALLGSKLIETAGSDSMLIDQDRNLHVRLNEGLQTITLHSISPNFPVNLSSTNQKSQISWPKSETWSWDAQERLLRLEMKGVAAINPARAQVPKEWQSLPSYVVTPLSQFQIELLAKQAGTAKKTVARLERQMWLDFRGRGFSIRDQIFAQNVNSSRLNMHAPEELEKVVLNQHLQPVTIDSDSSLRGVELRQDTLKIDSQSYLPFSSWELPISSWDLGLDQSKLKLNVPPGWEVLAARGADFSRGTRLSTWTLQTLLMLVVFALCALVNLGPVFAFFAALLFILVQGEANLIREFLMTALLINWALKQYPCVALKLSLAASLFCVAIVGLNYSQGLIKSSLNPLLDSSSAENKPEVVTIPKPNSQQQTTQNKYNYSSGLETNYNDERISGSVNAILTYSEGSFGALVMVAAGIAALLATSIGRFKVGAGFLALAICCFVLRSFCATFFNDISIEGGTSYPVADTQPQPNSGNTQIVRQQPEEILNNEIAYASPVVGRSMPQWTWRQAEFSWPEPVSKNQSLKVYLLSPKYAQIFNLVKVFLVTSLVLVTWRRNGKMLRELLSPQLVTGTVALFFMFFYWHTPSVEAQSTVATDRELLEQVKSELLKPSCSSGCLSTRQLKISQKSDDLVIEADLQSQGTQVWNMTFDLQKFIPRQAFLDGTEFFAVRLSAASTTSAQLQARIPGGSHRLTLIGHLLQNSEAEFRFVNGVGSLLLDLPLWERVPANSADGVIRIRPALRSSKEPVVFKSQKTIEDWFVVHRKLVLDENWKLYTRVERLGQTKSPVQLALPLVPGEQLLSEIPGTVTASQIALRFSENISQLEWVSLLPTRQELELSSSSQVRFNEDWSFSCSERWTCQALGPQVSQGFGSEGRKSFTWYSREGQNVKLLAQTLAPITGALQVVRAARITYTPQQRSLLVDLNLEIEASVAGSEKMRFPEQAELIAYQVDSESGLDELKNDKNQFEFDTHAGLHRHNFSFRIPWSETGLNTLYESLPRPTFEHEVSNLEIVYIQREGRVVVATVGPDPKALGPSLTYLVELFILLLLLAAASSFLNSKQVVFLGWVLSGLLLFRSAPTYLASFCFIATYLGYKNLNRFTGNMRNELARSLLILLLFTCLSMLVAFYRTLVFGPDLGVSGGESDARVLRWYLDLSSGKIPGLRVINVSLASIQSALLVWFLVSLWIVRKKLSPIVSLLSKAAWSRA